MDPGIYPGEVYPAVYRPGTSQYRTVGLPPPYMASPPLGADQTVVHIQRCWSSFNDVPDLLSGVLSGFESFLLAGRKSRNLLKSLF